MASARSSVPRPGCCGDGGSSSAWGGEPGGEPAEPAANDSGGVRESPGALGADEVIEPRMPHLRGQGGIPGQEEGAMLENRAAESPLSAPENLAIGSRIERIGEDDVAGGTSVETEKRLLPPPG